jgi:hypothetical protein
MRLDLESVSNLGDVLLQLNYWLSKVLYFP